MKNLCFLFLFACNFSFAQTTDANGKKQGYWKKNDPTGKFLLYEGAFKDDLPIGRFKYYYPNDSLRAVMNFKQNGKVAYAKLFHMNGKRMGEGKYIQEIKDSTWIYFDENGVLLSKDTYSMGKKNGISLVYLQDGKLAEERHFKMDVQDGPFKQYIDGKKLRGQGNYLNGQLEGKATYYYPNGVEVAAGFYKNGKKNGPWIYKSENGQIKEKEWYVDGELASPKETEAFFAKSKTVPVKEKQAVKTATNGLYNLETENKKK